MVVSFLIKYVKILVVMKILILNIFLSLFTVAASAVDLPKFESEFHFDKSQLKLQQVQHHVAIVDFSEAGKQAIKDLRRAGFTCLYVANSMHECKKFIRDSADDSAVLNQIVTEHGPLILKFEASSDNYTLISEGVVLQEYEKLQKSSFSKQSFDKVHFYITSDLKKFKLSHSGNLSAVEHFYINPSGYIAKQIQALKINKKTPSFVIEDRQLFLYEGIWKQ